jgi:hypothetical protein
MPMASLTGELRRREAAARHEVDELRGEVARLNERLARAGGEAVPAGDHPGNGRGDPRRGGHGRGGVAGSGAVDPAPAGARLAGGSPIGVVTVLPPSYRDLLEVLADAGRPLRAGASPPRPG